MIGAVIGILYALIAVSIWCVGTYFRGAHKETLAQYFDQYDYSLTVMITGALWPVGLPVVTAYVVGRHRHIAQRRRTGLQNDLIKRQRSVARDTGPR